MSRPVFALPNIMTADSCVCLLARYERPRSGRHPKVPVRVDSFGEGAGHDSPPGALPWARAAPGRRLADTMSASSGELAIAGGGEVANG